MSGPVVCALVIAPPHIRSVRLLVPLSSCNEAAPYIIQALGGPEQASRIAGGIRWWQVRGLQGIDANWVVAKKDIEALRKASRQTRSATTDSAKNGDSSPKGKEKASDGENKDEESSYATEMDSMPCMYFLHGGALDSPICLLHAARCSVFSCRRLARHAERRILLWKCRPRAVLYATICKVRSPASRRSALLMIPQKNEGPSVW